MQASMFAAVGVGAMLGAWARWGLAGWLNHLTPALPLGTLAANVGGGYAVGLAVAFFAAHPAMAPEWRLACITGFLGALTTFSSFSAESRGQLQAEREAAALESAVQAATSRLDTLRDRKVPPPILAATTAAVAAAQQALQEARTRLAAQEFRLAAEALPAPAAQLASALGDLEQAVAALPPAPATRRRR
jgi:CrcB protein